MIDIVIVDDEQKYHNKIKSIVSKIGIQYDTTINIKDYYNYDEYLESEIKNTDLAKIYILDINLSSSISGISIAKKIIMSFLVFKTLFIYLIRSRSFKKKFFSINFKVGSLYILL